MASPSLALVHATPGRMRLRLPSSARTAGLVEGVRVVDGVTECTWNDRTRSLLVRYRPEAVAAEAIIETVANHAAVDPPAEDDHEGGGDTAIAEVIGASVGRLNARISTATGRRLDLGILVPLVLGAWALRQLARAEVGALSWSSALWYAHGLFRDYAVRPRS